MRDRERRAERARKRQRILKSAIEVFSRKGFYHAKISEIARKAGVADGTIYIYFDNKDDLLISIFEEEMERIIQRFREELSKVSRADEKLFHFITLHARMVTEEPDLAHILQIELRQSSVFMANYKPVKFRQFLNILEEIFLEGQRQGIFPADLHPGIVKRTVFGAVDEMALHWILSNKSYDLVESAKKFAEIYLHGLRQKQPLAIT
jgi:TetR/AcrR family fatty acid metabolism transcriptional regulator